MNSSIVRRSKVALPCALAGFFTLAAFGAEPPASHGKTPMPAAPQSKPAAPALKPFVPVKPAAETHNDHHVTPRVAPTPPTPALTFTPPAAPVTTPANKVETPAATSHDEVVTGDKALAWLREGNERWVNNQPTSPHTDSGRREEVANHGQKPFATILTCADSRLPAERLFDRGVGDLFVVRVAGNVVSPEIAGTIDYGAEHLDVPLLVVMGHTKCGAVAAAASDAKIDGNVGALITHITPAVERARQQNPGADSTQIASASIRENVWQSIFDLIRSSDEVRQRVQEGKLKIMGAVCDVSTGKVEWIGAHPWQDALVDAFQARKTATAPATADAGGGH